MEQVLALAQFAAWGGAAAYAWRDRRPFLALFFTAQYVQSYFALWDRILDLKWWTAAWMPREMAVLACAALAVGGLVVRATQGLRGRGAVLCAIAAYSSLGFWLAPTGGPLLYSAFLAWRVGFWAAVALALVALLVYLWQADARVNRQTVQAAFVLAGYAAVVTIWSSLPVETGTDWRKLRAGYRLVVIVCCAGWIKSFRPRAVAALPAGDLRRLPQSPSAGPPGAPSASAADGAIPGLSADPRLQFRIRFSGGAAAPAPAETPQP